MSDSEKPEDATPVSLSDKQLDGISRAVAHGVAQGNKQLRDSQEQLVRGLITVFREEVATLVDELKMATRNLNESLEHSISSASRHREIIEALRRSLSYTGEAMYDLTSALRSRD